MSDVVNILWRLSRTLRHDGVDYADYIEQPTYREIPAKVTLPFRTKLTPQFLTIPANVTLQIEV